MSRTRSVYPPQPTVVEAAGDGIPQRVDGVAVQTSREDWLVEDRWWTAKPLRRHYYELVLVDGRNVVIFRDLVVGRWLRQSG